MILWWYSSRQISYREKNALKTVESRIENIVLATLHKVREDLGLISAGEEPKKKTGDEESEKVTFLGANVRTFNRREFYIDDNRFEVGDIVHPYGIAVAVGRDCVFFDDFSGKPVVLGKLVQQRLEVQPNSEEKKEKKELTSVKNFVKSSVV